MAMAVVASSCQKDLGGSPDSPVVPGAVPADFDWKTTRNVTVSVSAPVVEGATPPYAVIRMIYDLSAIAIGWLLGSTVGVVSIVTGFFLGPIIAAIAKKFRPWFA